MQSFSLVTIPVTPKAQDYMHLAEKFAYIYCLPQDRRNIKDSEFYSLACIWLCRAVKKYTPDKGDFESYAGMTIRNGLISHIRYLNRKRRSKKSISLCDFQLNNLVDQSSNDIEQNLEEEVKTRLVDFVLKSHKKETEQDRNDKELMLDVYCRGKSVFDLAKKNSCTRMTIYNRIQRITNKIRKWYSMADNN